MLKKIEGYTRMDFKSELEITAWEKECWVCGKKGGYLTTHHTLPKHLKPKKNFLCPVCRECHELINQNDTRGIISFAYKIQKSFDELKNMVEHMVEHLKNKGDEK